MLTLALQNIKVRKLRTLLASLSIAIGTASLIIFLGLSDGIRQATFTEIEKQSPLTQITVRPKLEKTNLISMLRNFSDQQIDEKAIAEIKNIDGIKAIYPEIQYSNFSSLEIDLLGMSLVTDTLVFGVPLDFIKNDLKNPEVWKHRQEPYPAIIPKKLLDLYNLTIASSKNLPTISEENLIGKELTLYPNYSTLFPIKNNHGEKVKLEVVGFSDKVNLIGVTLPDNIITELNEKYNPEIPTQILEIFVETEDATQTATIAKEIEELGYSTAYFQKNLNDVEAKFTYLKTSLGMISLIILLTAAIAIISTFLATITERTKEIGLFRALGATKIHIKKLILFEAGIIGLIGSVIGIGFGFISSIFLDKFGLEQLAKTTFLPETLFKITPELITYTIGFGILLAILAAYFPAQKAANINPIEALNRL